MSKSTQYAVIDDVVETEKKGYVSQYLSQQIDTTKGESLMLLGYVRHKGTTYRLFYGIGVVYRVVKREIDDLVYINFGVFKEHPRRLVVVHDNHARRQLLTLKRGQICHVYGLCRYFMGKGKKVDGKPTQELKMLLIATGILGWYVPTMVDIKKQGNNNDIVAPTDAENEIADFLGEIAKWKD